LYPFMRVVVGLMLVPHGIEKLMRGVEVFAANNPAKLGFWPPTAWGWAVTFIEVVAVYASQLGCSPDCLRLLRLLNLQWLHSGCTGPLVTFGRDAASNTR
jgi:hypothetical protein